MYYQPEIETMPVDELRALPELAALEHAGRLMVRGAIYHTHCGVVDFL